MHRLKLAAAALALGTLLSAGANAQTASGYVGQIISFGSNGWCPAGWLVADGSTLQISQYAVLNAIIGNTYGGNGTTTFALPNLRSVNIGPARVTWCIANTGTFPGHGKK